MHFNNLSYCSLFLTESVYDLLPKELQLQPSSSQSNPPTMSQKSGGEVGPPPMAPLASGELSNHLIKTTIWDHPLAKLFPKNIEVENLMAFSQWLGGNFTLSPLPHDEYLWRALCLYLNNGI